jgi:hypothetical protein
MQHQDLSIFIIFNTAVKILIQSSALTKRVSPFLFLLSIIFCARPVPASSQILKDTASLSIVKKSINDIYNLRFSESHEDLRKLGLNYPGHPVLNLLEGMQLYWENYPLSVSSPAYDSFEKNLRKSIELCESRKTSTNEAEYLLTNLSARGLLLFFYVDNDVTMSVISLASSTYRYIRRSFDYTSEYSDFFFFTGIYNYTREAYPEAYPAYKPLALLFPRGDKAKGMIEIRRAAENSIFFKAEAFTFLSGINLSFENNFEQAYRASKSLHELYPSNVGFLAFHLRNLLLTKRYDDAERLIEAFKVTNKYYLAQLSIFKGVLQEKKYKNDKLAEQLYTKGIQDFKSYGPFSNEFASYGYFGLSRICERKGDNNLKKAYRKKALELTDFRNVNFD